MKRHIQDHLAADPIDKQQSQLYPPSNLYDGYTKLTSGQVLPRTGVVGKVRKDISPHHLQTPLKAHVTLGRPTASQTSPSLTQDVKLSLQTAQHERKPYMQLQMQPTPCVHHDSSPCPAPSSKVGLSLT
eukprot:8128974-Pyramimonas_sp.AAC.4